VAPAWSRSESVARSTYFDGNGAAGHLRVLIAWTVLGFAAIILGHHSPIRFAAHPARVDTVAPAQPHLRDTVALGQHEDDLGLPSVQRAGARIRHGAGRCAIGGDPIGRSRSRNRHTPLACDDSSVEPWILSDEQIAALTVEQRRALMWRLARPVADVLPRRFDVGRVRRRRLHLMSASAAVLVPWTAYLGLSLPTRYVARHWTLTWVGFDVVLMMMFAATAVLGLLRRQLLVLTAFASGVLLLCDAWFDVTTANSHDRLLSIATAVVAEVPIAILLISGALRLVGIMARRLFLVGVSERLWRAPLLTTDDANARE